MFDKWFQLCYNTRAFEKGEIMLETLINISFWYSVIGLAVLVGLYFVLPTVLKKTLLSDDDEGDS